MTLLTSKLSMALRKKLAFVIAYTSDYIPRMVYTVVYSKTHDLTGYIDYSLSVFNTTHYTEEMRIDRKLSDKEPDTCQYRGYRNGPDNFKDPYGLSPEYWHVFAARLAFVVVFEHLVFALTGILAYVIPDVPAQVRTQIKRERLLAKEMRYQRGIKGDDLDDLIHTPSKLKDVIRRTSLDRRLNRNNYGKR